MEPPSPYAIAFQNETDLDIQIEPLERAAIATASRFQLRPGQIDVLLCDNASIQRLNREFRGIEEPTDVLTFPAGNLPWQKMCEPAPLGDIAISLEYASNQAKARNGSLADEAAYLVIHGVLHLCGFDDVEEGDRRRMQIAMAEMGERLGLEPEAEWVSLLQSHHALVAMEDNE